MWAMGKRRIRYVHPINSRSINSISVVPGNRPIRHDRSDANDPDGHRFGHSGTDRHAAVDGRGRRPVAVNQAGIFPYDVGRR